MRKEKKRLTCGTEVLDRFCPHCGQENIEPREPVGNLIAHFFKDITHFDGKFFQTLKRLATRPGFLTREYALGRRAHYVNPVRMYVFTSFVFFLIFFSIFTTGNDTFVNDIRGEIKAPAEVASMDSSHLADYTRLVNRQNGKADQPMSMAEYKLFLETRKEKRKMHITSGRYKTLQEFDSLNSAGKVEEGWAARQAIRQALILKKKYNDDASAIIRAIFGKLLHSLPQLLFISLPLLAIMLKLLYMRRKEYYYTDHAVFLLHFYVYMFLVMLVIFGLNEIHWIRGWIIITVINTAISFYLFYYLYRAMKNFYRQGTGKTLLKYFLLLLGILVLVILLFILFLAFSFFTI